MEVDQETFELAAKTALPYAKMMIESFILPVVSKRLRKAKGKSSKDKKIRKKIQDHLTTIYAQCSYINTIAFQNLPKRLIDLYVPLTLIHQEEQHEIEVGEGCTILEEYHSVLIVDDAGMGKSTISRRLALDYVIQQKRIPIILELRSFSAGTNLEQQTLDAIGIADQCQDNILSSLLLLLIFDGLDEVPLDARKAAIKEICRLRKLCSKSPALITSRPDSSLRLCRGFVTFKVKSLSEEQAFELLRKYDRNGVLSKKLITGIKAEPEPSISEFLTNPLYVSLLYCAYRHKPVIPRRKHIFYSEVYDALFEAHDLAKEPGFVHHKNSGLDSADFHSVLRRLGFWCLSHELRMEFLKDELEIILKKIGESLLGVHFKPSAFVTDLVETVPLFIKHGNKLRWSHKALLEYFSAMFICHDTKGKQVQILRKLYRDKSASSYLTVLELCADIDYGTFSGSIVLPLLRRMIRYGERVTRKIKNTRVKKKWIRDRIGLTFDRTIGLRLSSTSNMDLDNNLDKTEKTEFGDHLEKVFKDPKFKAKFEHPKTTEFHLNIQILINKKDVNAVMWNWSGVDSAIFKFLLDKEPGILHCIDDEENQNKNYVSPLKNSSLPRDIPLYVDFNDKNIVNNSRNFPVVNSFLKGAFGKWPDFEKVKIVYERINNDSSSGLKELLDAFD